MKTNDLVRLELTVPLDFNPEEARNILRATYGYGLQREGVIELIVDEPSLLAKYLPWIVLGGISFIVVYKCYSTLKKVFTCKYYTQITIK